MNNPSGVRCLVFLVAMGLSSAAFTPVFAATPGETINFQRDIRPILSNHCFQCHGPDTKTRQAELRLDLASAAIVELGGKAVRRDEPAESPLLKRILSSDPDERMPPADAHKPLGEAQKKLLVAWIHAGAPWDDRHWSYQPPQRSAIPLSKDRGSNPIDAFVRARLQKEGISPSGAADRITLARRLSLDLLGLPPDVDALDRYLADTRSTATENWVDSLLNSPHFGERMAVYWFDLVRFANSQGIHSDIEWEVAPYRNWVIAAFNSNMPFDQFTREQLAGDLMPNATRQQKIASGYNRLNLVTSEGGSQAKEFLVKYTADRVRNVSTVWLASTVGCAECHDHKFDPIASRDFYRLGAFFADIEQPGVYPDTFGPYQEDPTQEQLDARQRVQEQIDQSTADYERVTPEFEQAMLAWETEELQKLGAPIDWSSWHSVGPFPAENFDVAHDSAVGPEESLAELVPDAQDVGEKISHVLSRHYGPGDLAWQARSTWKDGEITPLEGTNSASYMLRQVTVKIPRKVVLKLGSDDGLRVWLNGRQVLDHKVTRPAKADEESLELELPSGTSSLLLKISNGGGGSGFYFAAAPVELPPELAAIVQVPRDQRSDEQRQKLLSHFRTISPLLQGTRERLASLQQQIHGINQGILRSLTTVSVAPLPIRVLPRGNWMDDTGELVEPGLPVALGSNVTSGSGGGSRLTRRDLAHWIVDRENPLTARVFVNRLWMLFFGTGITKSVDDFGTQGEMPTHLELLDWLAVEFMDSGWDIKHIVRLIVTSDTYAQSSLPRTELRESDPMNRLLASQSRYRVDAEFVRDLALSVSGRLNATVGGRAVSKPYQPAGYYRHLNFPQREYQNDTDANQYRRGVYMHRQRMFLHPSLMAFDAPSREECVAERRRSNTPLAALVLMNDPSYVEAARVFAMEIMRNSRSNRIEDLEWAFRKALSRKPSESERAVLDQLWVSQREMFAKHVEDTKKFLAIGHSSVPTDLDPADLAAWAIVGRALLNMHEMITRY
ncbi:MAG: PSD1 and planctomycete cytochrome C domain-containing protein [Planctomycetota bacterium]|nr:PSD1 and planctomycete cytochrome C domain-containing protein [Planctomycetota bacterium]MDA1178567.1 PSD1 and planctomycete cytochrome C domain-containing protein [Planctomycetota bacterium]